MQDLMKQDELTIIFSNIEEILMCNTIIYSDMEQIQREDDFLVKSIGDVMVRHVRCLLAFFWLLTCLSV